MILSRIFATTVHLLVFFLILRFEGAIFQTSFFVPTVFKSLIDFSLLVGYKINDTKVYTEGQCLFTLSMYVPYIEPV